MDIRLCAIAAMSRNRVIGRDNALPWHLSDDLKHFKRVTAGKPVIMGRKTYDSIGKPLPDRINIIISRDPDSVEGDVFAEDMLDTAIDRAVKLAAFDRVNEVFIIGGAQIYAAAMPLVQRLYLTVIDADYEGDTFFPPMDMSAWQETSSESFAGPPPFAIKVFDRL